MKLGARRGKYRCTTNAEIKKRILAAAESGDWKTVATANGVPVQTAYGWLRRGSATITPRGGSRRKKVEARHVNKMLLWLSENPLLTLTEIKCKLVQEEQLNVLLNTIQKKLDGQCFTLKKVISEPVAMNSISNKDKRATYVQTSERHVGNWSEQTDYLHR